MHSIVKIFGALVTLLFVCGCAPSKQERIAAYTASINSLKTIQFATENNVTLDKLNELSKKSKEIIAIESKKIGHAEIELLIESASRAYHNSCVGWEAVKRSKSASEGGISEQALKRPRTFYNKEGYVIAELFEYYDIKWSNHFKNNGGGWVSGKNFVSQIWAVGSSKTNAAAKLGDEFFSKLK